MTKEEIKALVSAKVAGQGNQVDISGALGTILDAIVDAIPEGGGDSLVIHANVNDISNASKSQFAQFLGVSEKDVDNIFAAKVPSIYDSILYGYLSPLVGWYKDGLGRITATYAYTYVGTPSSPEEPAIVAYYIFYYKDNKYSFLGTEY